MNTKCKVYRCCGVPQCKNTTIKTPRKLFVHVPNKKPIRNKWFKLAQRDPTSVKETSAIYFCEDHFDLPNDMDNYMEYHIMGSVLQVRMRPECTPTKFECQRVDRKKRKPYTRVKPYIKKKQRKTLIQECEKEEEKTIKSDLELGEYSSGSLEQPQENQAMSSIIKDEYQDMEERNQLEYKIDICQHGPTGNIEMTIATDDAVCEIKSEPEHDVKEELPIHNNLKDVEDFILNNKVLSIEDILLENEDKCNATKNNRRGQITPVTVYSKKTNVNHRVIEGCCIPSDDIIKGVRYSGPSLTALSGQKGSEDTSAPRKINKFNAGIHCRYKSRDENALISHMSTHNDEINCFGENKFKYKSPLLGHISIDSGEEPYICSLCERKYRRKVCLINHMRTHSEEPYACEHCQYKCEYKSELILHLQAHHGDMHYTCNLCGRKFAQKGA